MKNANILWEKYYLHICMKNLAKQNIMGIYKTENW